MKLLNRLVAVSRVIARGRCDTMAYYGMPWDTMGNRNHVVFRIVSCDTIRIPLQYQGVLWYLACGSAIPWNTMGCHGTPLDTKMTYYLAWEIVEGEETGGRIERQVGEGKERKRERGGSGGEREEESDGAGRE